MGFWLVYFRLKPEIKYNAPGLIAVSVRLNVGDEITC